VLALAGVLASGAQAQERPENPEAGSGRIVARVRLATSVDIPVAIDLVLSSSTAFLRRTHRIVGNGEVTFHDLPLAVYQLEARAEGFQMVMETVYVTDRNITTPVILFLLPESSGPAQPGAPKPPVLLAPRAQREADRALAALRENKPEEARKNIERALKMAPGHPQVNYLAGLIFTQLGKLDEAIPFLEKAAQFDQASAPIHMALGNLYYRQKNYDKAVPTLERCVVLAPEDWRAHWTLANALFQVQEFEKTIAHAVKARELDANRVPEAPLVIGFAHAELGRTEEAREELEKFVAANPSHARAPVARQKLESMAAPQTVGAAEPLTAPPAAAPAPVQPPAAPAARWSPPVVAETGPPVTPGLACSMPDVQRAVGRNIVDLVRSMERVSAKEVIFHEDLGADGIPRSQLSRDYDYVASIRTTRPGMLSVEEYRQRGGNTELFLQGMYTTGLAALALIFHPDYAGDFDMRCEGVGLYRGQPAWQIYFVQKEDVESRVRTYHTERGRFPVSLKGRAWFGANTYQILRIEVGLAAPVKAIDLEAEHMSIDYVPVQFPQRNLILWLPATAVMYADFRGRRIRRMHQLSDFTLFSVETKQSVKSPGNP